MEDNRTLTISIKQLKDLLYTAANSKYIKFDTSDKVSHCGNYLHIYIEDKKGNWWFDKSELIKLNPTSCAVNCILAEINRDKL